MTSETITLRPATPEDRFRIRRWLAEPEIQAWWGNAASAEAEINLAMASDTALCRIVEADGAPIGYAHAVEIGIWGAPRPEEVPPGEATVTLTVPAAWAGAAAVIQVAERTVNGTESVPNFTSVAPAKLVPVRLTTTPPAVLPEVRLRLDRVGVAAAV